MGTPLLFIETRKPKYRGCTLAVVAHDKTLLTGQTLIAASSSLPVLIIGEGKELREGLHPVAFTDRTLDSYACQRVLLPMLPLPKGGIRKIFKFSCNDLFDIFVATRWTFHKIAFQRRASRLQTLLPILTPTVTKSFNYEPHQIYVIFF